MPYIGNSPGTGTRNRFIYTATASQTTFSGADDNGKTLKYADSDYVDVYLNGICLVPVTDYTSTSKTSIVLTQAASLNDTLEVVAYDIATISDTVSKADGGNFEAGVNVNGNVGIGTTSPNRALTLEDGDIQIHDTGTSGDPLLNFSVGGTQASPTQSWSMRIDNSDSDKFQLMDVTDSRIVLTADGSGNVGIGTADIDVSTQAGGSGYRALQIESDEGGQLNFDHNDAGTGSTLGQINFQRAGEVLAEIEGVTDGATDSGRVALRTQGTGGALTERMRINADGAMFFCTDFNAATSGARIEVDGDSYFTAEGGNGRAIYANRLSSDGYIIELARGSQSVAAIGISGGNNPYLAGTQSLHASLTMATRQMLPGLVGVINDDGTDLGSSSNRFRDIYAGNSSIQTSDEREKQQIVSLTDAEITAAKAISKLFKNYKWNSSVEEKGDNARIHTGVIAQQVEQAMTDAGLDAGDYGFFINSTWWEVERTVPAVEANEAKMIEAREEYIEIDNYHVQSEAPEGATERNRKGIRYPELLSFIGAATEQRLTSIEARLDALEG